MGQECVQYITFEKLNNGNILFSTIIKTAYTASIITTTTNTTTSYNNNNDNK
jgi:hypothetical protein